MDEMTLREICEKYGISRRAIQGYEKVELISASGRSKRGYLLYDVNTQERIKQIKLFQQFGFSLKEIKELIDAPKAELKIALEERIVELKLEKEQMESLIEKARALVESL